MSARSIKLSATLDITFAEFPYPDSLTPHPGQESYNVYLHQWYIGRLIKDTSSAFTYIFEGARGDTRFYRTFAEFAESLGLKLKPDDPTL